MEPARTGAAGWDDFLLDLDEVDLEEVDLDDEEEVDLDLDFFAGGLSHAQKVMNESTCEENQTIYQTPMHHAGNEPKR